MTPLVIRQKGKTALDWMLASANNRAREATDDLLAMLRLDYGNPERPKVVCMCGSSRFIELFATLSWTLERDLGVIVLGLHYLPPSYPGIVPDHLAEAEGVADKLDELHKRKIDLADEILVLNVGKYIGDSTRSEIVYATAHGKPVKYIERED